MNIKTELFVLFEKMEMPIDKKKKFFRNIYKQYKKTPDKKILKKLKYYQSIPFLNNITRCSVEKLFKPSRLIMVEQLEARKHLLKGSFITKKNSYEKAFCDIMGWSCVSNKDPNSRYYDCTNYFSCIELKKGQGMMWFDMVRYAEIFLKKGKQHTVTVYIDYNMKRAVINEIYIIPTSKLVKFLRLDKDKAERCLEFYRDVPRGLNMQASAYKKDLRQMAARIIKL